MFGPFCDYVTSASSFEEVIGEFRVHAKTHHERDITDKEVLHLRQLLEKSTARRPAA